MQDKIKMFLENSESYTANDILKAVSDVENIILSAANMSLSKPKQKKSKKNIILSDANMSLSKPKQKKNKKNIILSAANMSLSKPKQQKNKKNKNKNGLTMI